MHAIEPYFRWLDLYNSEEDSRSPFFERFHSEFEYTHQIYNYLIHPQWDDIGSTTLFIRVIYVDYINNYAIIEMIGEWNDAINNDIMLLKREVFDSMALEGINHYILIGENVLNFHFSDDCYYEEWFDELNETDGWAALINFKPHVILEMNKYNIDQYLVNGGEFDDFEWRTFQPKHLFNKINSTIKKRLT